jgi:hypothetical protein
MQMPLLVKSSITINGRKFTTMIHEGASAEELIAKVAKENGGGVARVYYPELKTHEIVAVKIGEQLIVKGDPKRVEEGDFSDFQDSEMVKSAAVSASSSSKGGIHFFVGSEGIPMAAAENQGIVFPNAQELRVSTNINNLSLAVVDYNVDPNSIRDINRLYEKGARISQDAKREIEKSHGGVRSEKLMLPDTSVLILSRESGNIRTASEFASNFRAEGFMSKQPAAPQQFFAPQHIRRGLALPTDLGVMHIPLDGSSSRIPYLCVKVFDGKLTDAIRITRREPECIDFPGRRKKKPKPAPAPRMVASPEFIGEAVVRELKPSSAIPTTLPKTETIMAIFSAPRPEPQKAPEKAPAPVKFNREVLPAPAAAQAKHNASRAPAAKSRAPKGGPKAAKHKAAKSAGGKILKVGGKKADAKRKAPAKPKPKKRKGAKPKDRKPAKPKSSKPKNKKPKPASHRATKPKPKTRKKQKPAHGRKPIAKPNAKTRPRAKSAKKPKPAAFAKRKPRKKVITLPAITVIARAKSQKRMSKKKKKKIQSYYMNSMLGLLKSKRSGAGNSRRRKTASRT